MSQYNRTAKKLTTPALVTDGALRIPDLSQFEGTTYSRVRCTICLKSGPVEEVWILSCLAGHPAVCEVEGCDRVFTTNTLLASHTRHKHPESFGWVEGESKDDRTKRLKQENRARLKAAGIRRDEAA